MELSEDLAVSSLARGFSMGVRDPYKGGSPCSRARLGQVGRRGRKLWSNCVSGIEESWLGDPPCCNRQGLGPLTLLGSCILWGSLALPLPLPGPKRGPGLTLQETFAQEAVLLHFLASWT